MNAVHHTMGNDRATETPTLPSVISTTNAAAMTTNPAPL